MRVLPNTPNCIQILSKNFSTRGKASRKFLLKKKILPYGLNTYVSFINSKD